MSTITQFPSGNTQYRIEFDYLARTFVVVTLVNSSNPTLNRVLEVGRDYRFLNPTMVEMLVDQSGFDIVRIHRQTGTELVVDFRNGSVLTASDLTNAELQAIHIAEEGRDQTVDLAKEYADAAGNSAGNAKDSEDEARRLAESIKSAGLFGYITRRSFEKGFNITTWNEVLLWEEDGDYYRWDGTLPKSVPAGSTPETSGGIGLGAWVSVGDASLRSALAGQNGVDLVNGAAKQDDVDKLSIHTSGYVNVLEYIPENLHQYLTDFTQSQTNAGDLITYLNAASAYCETNHKDLVFPFGYYFVSNTFMLPAGVKVIGLGYPYIISLSPFNSSNIIVSCDKTGQPTYDMEGFNINGPGASNLNMVGLRVGGCRNSTFRRIAITSCFSAGVEVYPTVATSGDVENLHLDHIWTVQSGGVRFKANDAISRGNITDAEVTNCQLTTGSATLSGPPAITITGAPGRLIFGIEFSRVFTQVTDVDHIVINPNGGSIFHNTFSVISGESWSVASGGLSNSFSKNALYVLNGDFTSNAFRDFYKQSLPGNGITLGVGSSGNIFDGLRFTDRNVVGYNNRWLIIPSGANSNSFSNCYFDGCFNRADTGYGAVAANYVFRANDGKISDLSGSTKFDTPEIRDVAQVLVKRSNIFAISGNQLVNYPVPGCAFATTSDGISVAVPAGSAPYFLTIPFTTTAGFAGKFIGLTIKYVCGAMNGMILAADICGAGSSMTDLTQNKSNVFSAYGAYNAANKTVTISFLGNRSAQANMVIQDIIITEGANIPYIPNFRKIYIES